MSHISGWPENTAFLQFLFVMIRFEGLCFLYFVQLLRFSLSNFYNYCVLRCSRDLVLSS